VVDDGAEITDRDHPLSERQAMPPDRASLPVMRPCRRQSISEATRYRSAVVIPDGSPCGRATRIQCNLSDAGEDSGGASKQDGHSKLRGFWGHRVRRVDPVLSRLNEGAGAV
jgi:hypothetical protein